MKLAIAFGASSLLAWIPGADVKLAQAPAPLRVIRGAVVDPEGRPVPAAHVTIRNPDRQVLSQAVAGPSGVFEIGLDEAADLEATNIDLDIEAHGFTPIHLVNFPRTPQLNCDMGRVRLNRPREIRGVVRSQEGAPVSGAMVHFWPYVKWYRPAHAWPTLNDWGDLGQPLPDPMATTAEDGSFAFRELGPGLYNWAVSRRGFVTFHSQKYAVGEADTNELAITLESVPLTSARVVDTFGDPIEGVKVAVRFQTTTTDKNGMFEFEGISRASEYVMLQKLGFHTVAAPRLRPPENMLDTSPRAHARQPYVMGIGPIVRLTFDETANATSRVRSLQMWSMNSTGWNTLSERDLAIDRISPSQWLVQCPVRVDNFRPLPELFGLVTADGGGWSSVLFEMDARVPPPSTSRQVRDFRVIWTPPACISGSLTDLDNRPIGAAWIVAQVHCDAYESLRYGTWSRPDGSFDLTIPNAPYRLTASLPDQVLTIHDVDTRNPATPRPIRLKASVAPPTAFPHSLDRDRSMADFANLDEE